MEITYIKNGKEKTLKGWKAGLFLFSFDLQHEAIDFLHIKGAKFKNKGDLCIDTGNFLANLILEDCEFSCEKLKIYDYYVVQFKNNIFKQDCQVVFDRINELELNLLPSEKKIKYLSYGTHFLISGNGENAQISGIVHKTRISKAFHIFMKEFHSSNFEICSSEVTIERYSGSCIKLIDSKLFGKNLNLTVTLENSKIESEGSLKVNGIEYPTLLDNKVVVEDAILSANPDINVYYPNKEYNSHKGTPICLVNNNNKLERIGALLSVWKTLENRCMENRVAEISNEVIESTITPKIEEYVEQMQEYKKKIDDEYQRAKNMKEIVRKTVASTPIKRVLK